MNNRIQDVSPRKASAQHDSFFWCWLKYSYHVKGKGEKKRSLLHHYLLANIYSISNKVDEVNSL